MQNLLEAAEPKAEDAKPKDLFGLDQYKEKGGNFEFSFAGLFTCLLCTYEKSGEKEILRNIQESLKQLDHKLNIVERRQIDPKFEENRRNTTLLTGN